MKSSMKKRQFARHLFGLGMAVTALLFSNMKSVGDGKSSMANDRHAFPEMKNSFNLYLTDEDRKLSTTPENLPFANFAFLQSRGEALIWNGYFLEGDINGNQYGVVLYFEGGTGAIQLKAEILVNENVVAQKSFTCTDCILPTPAAFTFSGTNPVTKTGDEVRLKVTNESGGFINMLWGSTDEPSAIVLPSVVTAVEAGETESLPEDIVLYQNYPNPFNAGTMIRYQLRTPSDAVLKIYNVRGQLMKTLVEKIQSAGFHSVMWEGDDESGRPVPNGLYFYKLKTKDFEQIKKTTLIR